MPRKITVTKADVIQATRIRVKAAIGIDGISGDGKTGLMIEIAHVLEPDWSKIHITDTENKSFSLYIGQKLQSGDIVPEDTIHHASMSKATGYSPFNYDFFREDAVEKGCTVVGMDSFTHGWSREGGVLDSVSKINEDLAKNNRKPNKFAAWNDPDVIAARNLIFDLIRDNRVHVISTLRIKDDYVILAEDGKNVVKNVGLKQIQQEGLKYEYDLLLRVIRPADAEADTPARVEVLKSRYSLFHKGEEYDIDKSMLKALAEYLDKGTSREELDVIMKAELIEGLKEQIGNDTSKKLYTVLKNTYPDRKLDTLTLAELRGLNAKFIEVVQ